MAIAQEVTGFQRSAKSGICGTLGLPGISEGRRVAAQQFLHWEGRR